jgi:hypothetical protein
LLLLANHKPNPVIIKNRLIQCDRGETLRSLDTLRKRWSWSKSAVRRFLRVLEEEKQIVTKNETQTTRITICNYSDYQGFGNASEPEVKRKRNASETQTTPNNNDNNENNENNVKNLSSKVIPADARKMTKAQQKRIRVNYNNPVMDEIGSWFYTKPRLWTAHEAIMLDQLRPPEEERKVIAKLYATEYEYRRKSLSTLLANWTEELDRADNYFNKPQANKKLSAEEIKAQISNQNMNSPC